MPAISVIMPVYNAAKYLAKAIDSVLSQTFTDFELILINDGSKDSSHDICKQYAEKDKRIVLINQQNAGVSGARNTGLANAKGEYIAFCDNDDEYLPDLLETNYRLAKQYDADIVKYGENSIIVNENGDKIANHANAKGDDILVYKDDEILKNYRQLIDGIRLLYVWDGLYRNDIIKQNNIIFDESIRFGEEDRKFNFEYFRYVKTFVLNNKIYYLHYKRALHSTSFKYDDNRIESILKCMSVEYQNIKSMEIEKYVPNYWCYAVMGYLTFLLLYINNYTSTLSIAMKKKILIKLSSNEFMKAYDKKSLMPLWKASKRRALVYWLFHHKAYTILLFFSKYYSRYKKS